MADYRIFLIGADGHISEPPRELECRDDDEALRSLDENADFERAVALELWDGPRRLARREGVLQPKRHDEGP